MKQAKSNNKGFSLIELLVAICILAIIAIPIMKSFVISANTSAKGRRLGNATLVAQNLIETVQAEEITGLETELNSSYTLTSSQFLDASGADLVNPDGSTMTGPMAAKEADSMIFTMTGFPAGMKAELKLETAPYAAINDKKISEFTEMESIFAQSRSQIDDPDQISYDDYRLHVAGLLGTIPRPTQIDRTIKIKVDKQAAADPADPDKLFIELRYHYRYSYSDTDILTGAVTSGSYENEQLFTLFPQGYAMVGGKGPNVYLLYYPLYSNNGYLSWASFGSTAVVDVIDIDNSQEVNFNLFLVKQKDPEMSDSEINTLEPVYRMTVIERVGAMTNMPVASIYANDKVGFDHLSTTANVKMKLYAGAFQEFDRDFAGGVVIQKPKKRMYQVKATILDKNDEVITSLDGAKLQ